MSLRNAPRQRERKHEASPLGLDALEGLAEHTFEGSDAVIVAVAKRPIVAPQLATLFGELGHFLVESRPRQRLGSPRPGRAAAGDEPCRHHHQQATHENVLRSYIAGVLLGALDGGAKRRLEIAWREMERHRWWMAAGMTALVASCAQAVAEDEGADPTGSGASGSGASGGGGSMMQQGPGPGPTTGVGAMGGGGNAGVGGNLGGGGTMAGCGNGVMDAGEGCDDGNMSNDDSCPDDVTNGGTCQPAACGDGFVWSTDGGTEGCDDGNGVNEDDCPDGVAGSCQAATCTDGFLHNAGTGDEEEADCGGSCPSCTLGLLLSEIVVTPTGSELIEIHNPTTATVSLDGVYLADYASYYLITTATGAPGASDFRVTFPASSTIPAGGHIVISTQSAADFSAAFGFAPDYDFDALDAGAPAMVGEIDAAASLTNSDEMLVLFRWDGQTELVDDVDYVVWGDTSDAMDKTGITVGASTYLADTAPASQSPAAAPPSGMAIGHCVHSEGAEISVGGNGVDGSDESSEDNANTWDVVAPTPGTFNNCPVLAAVSRDDATLYHLDRLSLAEVDTTTITSSVTFDTLVAMARHPTTGQVFVVLNDASFGTRYLARLNTATGEAVVVAALSDMVSSLAFDAAGTLYGMLGNGATSSEFLVTINTATAALTSVLDLMHLDDGEAIALHPSDGHLFRFSGNSTPELFDVDLGVPSASQVTTSGLTGEVTAAFWDPDLGEFIVFDLSGDVWQMASDGTTITTGNLVTSIFRGLVIQ